MSKQSAVMKIRLLGSSPFMPLKIKILPQNFIWLYRVHSKVNVKKKNGADTLF